MWKTIAIAALVSAGAAPLAVAEDNENGAQADTPRTERLRAPERLGVLDRRLTRAERFGRIEQGSRADFAEDRFDRFEDRVDRRESRRDEAIDFGRRDVIEDRLDRAESVLDRRENRFDRRRRG